MHALLCPISEYMRGIKDEFVKSRWDVNIKCFNLQRLKLLASLLTDGNVIKYPIVKASKPLSNWNIIYSKSYLFQLIHILFNNRASFNKFLEKKLNLTQNDSKFS